ncbi:MAG: hypothetical protein ACRYFX_14735 [Janthinobacterium lividum]
MGHEYKLVTTLTTAQQEALSGLLESLPSYYWKYSHAGQEIREFRRPENLGEMPDFWVIFELDGLYVCKNDAPNIWQNLGEVLTTSCC